MNPREAFSVRRDVRAALIDHCRNIIMAASRHSGGGSGEKEEMSEDSDEKEMTMVARALSLLRRFLAEEALTPQARGRSASNEYASNPNEVVIILQVKRQQEGNTVVLSHIKEVRYVFPVHTVTIGQLRTRIALDNGTRGSFVRILTSGNQVRKAFHVLLRQSIVRLINCASQVPLCSFYNSPCRYCTVIWKTHDMLIRAIHLHVV